MRGIKRRYPAPPPSREEEHVELNRWHAICDQLKAAGAVTVDDLRSPTHIPVKRTPGEKILEAIRQWGDARVALALKIGTRPGPSCIGCPGGAGGFFEGCPVHSTDTAIVHGRTQHSSVKASVDQRTDFTWCEACANWFVPGPPERIHLDGKAWYCLCLNDTDRDGFYPCTPDGIEVEPDEAWGQQGFLYCCARCGRIISGKPETGGDVVGVRA